MQLCRNCHIEKYHFMCMMSRSPRQKPNQYARGEKFWVLSSLERMNMVKIFTIIEKQVYKKVTHFGGQISKDFEVFLRRYPSPFRSGFERGQSQDYAANLQFAS